MMNFPASFRRCIGGATLPGLRLLSRGRGGAGARAAAAAEAAAVEFNATSAEVFEENRIDNEWAKSVGKAGLWATPQAGCAYTDKLVTPSTIGEYIDTRGYAGVQDQSPVRMLSTMLTYPLSLSFGIRSIFGERIDSLNVTVIGARKESSLPSIWWEETMRTCSIKRLDMSMVGPGLNQPPPPHYSVSRDLGGGLTREFAKHYTSGDIAPLHDHPDARKILLETNLFVLYNPGLGSGPLKELWKPTLELLLSTKKPILCTSHCQFDMDRDLATINAASEEDVDPEQGQQLEYLINPTVNPFRSMQRAVDKNEVPGAQILNCNYGIYAFQAK
jgi:splicing suppressor protein 51